MSAAGTGDRSRAVAKFNKLGRRFTFPTRRQLSTHRTAKEECRETVHVLVRPSQRSDLNPLKSLWRDLKIQVGEACGAARRLGSTEKESFALSKGLLIQSRN